MVLSKVLGYGSDFLEGLWLKKSFAGSAVGKDLHRSDPCSYRVITAVTGQGWRTLIKAGFLTSQSPKEICEMNKLVFDE